MTFSNISVIPEDIYLKLRIVVIKRGIHTGRGGNPPIFLTKLCPFFDLQFSKCSYSRALAPACSALVSFMLIYKKFFFEYIKSFCFAGKYLADPDPGVKYV